jgi:ribosome recycling factor
MTDKHMEFAESLRNIMRNEKKHQWRNVHQSYDENSDDDSRSLQEMLEAQFDELFGQVDDD